MKTILMVFTALAIVASSAFAGGPSIGISINPGRGWCPPPRPICPPTPVIYRSYPTWYATPSPAFYSWGPSVVVSSSGPSSGFSTVSPVMNYQAGAPIYRVPPPVIPSTPVTVYPNSAFTRP